MLKNLSIHDIRRLNTLHAVQHLKVKADRAQLLDLDPSQLSQLLGTTPFRNIGDTLARKFEARLGKPHLWLDQQHTDLTDALGTLEETDPELLQLTTELITAISSQYVDRAAVELLKSNMRYVINRPRASYDVAAMDKKS